MEKIVGSLVEVSYHTFDTLYDLLFTTERVIAFIIQHPNDIPYHPSLKGFFFGGMPAKRTEQSERAKIAQARRNSLQEKSINELVALHPLNFEIRYTEVTSVEITRGLFQSQLRFDVLKLSTTRQKIRFMIKRFRLFAFWGPCQILPSRSPGRGMERSILSRDPSGRQGY